MTSRRQFVATAGAAALAGCSEALTADRAGDSPYSPGEERTAWPLSGFDDESTSYAPDAAAPRAEPSQRWSTELEGDVQLGPGAFRRPLVADGAVVLPWRDGVVAFDAASGDRRWRVEGETGGRAAIGGGNVYTTVGDVGNFAALSLQEGTERWAVETPRTVATPPVFGDSDGRLFAGDPRGTVYEMNRDTGEVESRTDAFGRIETLANHGGPLVGTGAGEVYRFVSPLDAGATERWRRKLVGGVTDLAFRDDGVVVATEAGRVYRLDNRRTGATAWSREFRGPDGRLAVTDHHVLHVDTDAIRLLDPETGEARWSVDGDWEAGPVVAGDTVYVGDGAGVTALAAFTGDRRWRFDTGERVAALSVADSAVFAATTTGALYALE